MLSAKHRTNPKLSYFELRYSEVSNKPIHQAYIISNFIGKIRAPYFNFSISMLLNLRFQCNNIKVKTKLLVPSL